MSPNKNFFLITIDDLRRDRTSLECERDATPNLEKFAAENSYQDNHFSNAPASPSSFKTIFSSTYHFEYQIDGSFSRDRPYLPEKISEEDIRTVGLTTNPHISTAYGYDKGYDSFDDTIVQDMADKGHDSSGSKVLGKLKDSARRLPFKNFLRVMRDSVRGRSTPYMEAEQVTDRAIELIESGQEDESSFYWFHYMDPHSPFMPPEETYGTWNSFGSKVEAWNAIENEDEKMVDLYDECVLYMDRHLGRLIEFIQENFEEDEYEILITSDHGELFPGDGTDFTGHPEVILQKLFEVPLFFTDESLEDRDFSTHSDIAPTILDCFDIEIPEKMNGESMYSKRSQNFDFVQSFPMSGDEIEDERKTTCDAAKVTAEGIQGRISLDNPESYEGEDQDLMRHAKENGYSPDGVGEESGSDLSEKEEEKVKENLRKLGYDE
jgi:arylsulfatase A-like enzyme